MKKIGVMESVPMSAPVPMTRRSLKRPAGNQKVEENLQKSGDQKIILKINIGNI
jgi:hypothetical protein